MFKKCEKDGMSATPTWLTPIDIAGAEVPYSLSFHQAFPVSMMSTGMSKVDVALFPSF